MVKVFDLDAARLRQPQAPHRARRHSIESPQADLVMGGIAYHGAYGFMTAPAGSSLPPGLPFKPQESIHATPEHVVNLTIQFNNPVQPPQWAHPCC